MPLPPLSQSTNKSPEPAMDGTNALKSGANLGGYAPLLPEPATASTDPANAAINPQSVLGYLTPPPTNAPPVQFLAPMFVPPMAPTPPSSKATYESR